MRVSDCSIVFLVGLPGCGKTTLALAFQQQGWELFDDFKANAINNLPALEKLRHFDRLIKRAREGSRSVVADIDFCSPESREEAEHVLRTMVPGINLGWLFFAKDTNACEKNIRRRNRSSLTADLECLHRYAAIYSVPDHAEVLPVWSNSVRDDGCVLSG